jgi:hypothetical protein
MDRSGTSKHHIASLIPETGHRRARIGPWAGAGLLAGGCLGCGYGFLVVLTGGAVIAACGAAAGGIIGLIAGPLIGFLIGLAQVLLRRTAIPAPVIAVAVTEFILLPLQLLAAGTSWPPGAGVVFIDIPSALGIAAAAALGFLLPPATRPLRRRGEPDTALPRPPGNSQQFGVTGLRLRAYRRRRAVRRS